MSAGIISEPHSIAVHAAKRMDGSFTRSARSSSAPLRIRIESLNGYVQSGQGRKLKSGGADRILRAWYYKIPLARKIPAVREYLLEEDMFLRPADLVPPSMRDIEIHELVGGLLYCLSFRKP